MSGAGVNPAIAARVLLTSACPLSDRLSKKTISKKRHAEKKVFLYTLTRLVYMGCRAVLL